MCENKYKSTTFFNWKVAAFETLSRLLACVFACHLPSQYTQMTCSVCKWILLPSLAALTSSRLTHSYDRFTC